MKKIILNLALITGLMISTFGNQTEQSKTIVMKTSEKESIETLLLNYRDALNASDVDQVMKLYTTDGVFMPSNAPTSMGTDQVRGAYEYVFSNIKLNIEFNIDEVELAGDYAFARTTSQGTTLIHASGETVPEENRELFVLKQVEGAWKIDRYMFNKMK